MTTLILAIGSYSVIWFFGMYFMLGRLIRIRRNIEKRVHDFDGEYIMPAYKKPWVYTLILGILSYVVSVFVIILFLR